MTDMTIDDAIQILDCVRPHGNAGCGANDEEIEAAINMAIKALRQQLVLDKIRAEIESQRKEVSNKNSVIDELQAYYDGLNDGLKDARDTCDKYKMGSEE